MPPPISASSVDDAWVIDSIEKAMPPPLSSERIPRVPKILVSNGSNIYDEYYTPRVVSIGPYHYGKKKLELVEKLKPVFTKELLLKYSIGLCTLSKRLGEATMVKELRSFYEEKSTDNFTDKEFTRMMLLDGCFILYYFVFIFRETGETTGETTESWRKYLKSHQIVFIQQDLFLLENQIPFKVIKDVMNLIKLDRLEKIGSFFMDNILLVSGRQKSRWFGFGSHSTQTDQNSGQEYSQEKLESIADRHHHLLHLRHSSLTQRSHPKTSNLPRDEVSNICTFRNVNELVDVGIHFKPSSIRTLAHIEFVPRWWWWCSADVKLPPIMVDDSTKTMLLNLIAYEMCVDDEHLWVTSYICLLDSLIDQPEDVKALRKAGVLDNSLGSDQEVATLFNEIGTNLVPNFLAYLTVKNQIQRHYDYLRNTRISQLKHEYIKSPWSFLALIGALMALSLSGVQTYFTVWSPEGVCDNLCTFLKINHHL